MKSTRTIAIASTFTVDPLRDCVEFWLNHMAMPGSVVFAPSFQLFQTLLDPQSVFNTNTTGLNVALLRWQDLDPRVNRDNNRVINDLTEALRLCIGGSKVPLLAIVCPPSLKIAETQQAVRLYPEWDRRIEEEFTAFPNAWLTSAHELETLFPFTTFHSSYGDELAQIPFCAAFYATIGTLISRKFHLLTTPSYKAIVVDCDGTLWGGLCGEDGPNGVRVEEPHRALQELLVSQNEQGALICLCSKNNEEDVEAVFRIRSDMPLRRDHVTAARINWLPKAENILSIAQELGLGTDSIVLLDDNPVECEFVRQALPHVVTLELPAGAGEFPAFLRRVWAFDRLPATKEDLERTNMYRQERQREQLRKSSASLEDFLAGLQLNVEVGPITETNLSRVSQLTYRVNQFNLTTVRRTEAEIAALLAAKHLNGLTVNVRDRFGEYGLVGLILFATAASAIEVETFLLSCRALGRGVEQRIMAELAAIARRLELGTVILRFTSTSKNQPARDFLDNDLGRYRESAPGHIEYRVPVDFALHIGDPPSKHREEPPQPQGVSLTPSPADSAPEGNRAARIAWIASHMIDADKIWAAIQAWKQKTRPELQTGFIPPRSDLEQLLAQMWREVLELDEVGVQDNFFGLGGDSLAMVKTIIRIYERLGVELPISAFAEEPTVEAHTRRIAALKAKA